MTYPSDRNRREPRRHLGKPTAAAVPLDLASFFCARSRVPSRRETVKGRRKWMDQRQHKALHRPLSKLMLPHLLPHGRF